MPKRFKKYLVFIWPQYEARGGMYDFSDSFFTLEEAEKYLNEYVYPFDETRGHVTDKNTGEIVYTRE